MLKKLGLLAFSAEFLKGGWNQTQNAERMAEQAQKAGVQVDAQFVRMCGYVMMACGVGLQIPFLRRVAALVLAGMLAPITYIGHRFWEMEDAQQRNQHLTHALKNTTMLGGALFIAGSE